MKVSKEIKKGSVQLLILSILSEGEEYGYSLSQEIKKRSDDILKAGDGTLYPTLYKMEAEKLIKSQWNDDYAPRRKYYFITKKGRSQLKQQIKEWKSFVDMLQKNFELQYTT